MSRPQVVSVVVKAVLAALAVAVLVVLATIDNAGCAIGDSFTDLGTVEALCRAPASCYLVGADCACARERKNAPPIDPAELCRVPLVMGQYCNVASSVDDMNVPASHCKLPGTQCVGRATQTCDGVGARCLPVGGSCSQSGGNPPDRIGSGPNGTLENRCTYVDDVCCPGTINADAGTTDGSAPDPDAGT